MDPAHPRAGRPRRHRIATGADEDRSPGPVVLNRRAATRPTVTGVERWTAQVTGRLAALAPDRYVVAQPRPRARRRAAAQAWEQLALPARAARLRAALIFSPANLAPLAWPRNVLVMHDAAALREPLAYSAAYRAWHGRLGLACARRAIAVITVSEFSRGELVDVAGLDPGRLTVIPGGVDERFTPDVGPEPALRRLGLDRPYALTIATDDPRKNLAALAPVSTALAAQGIELVWAGDSRPYFARSRSVAGLRSIGYVDDADLPALYRGARTFVLPSRYEGFGLTCLEAMACGTPVVAADRAALPETCGDAALLVDPDDPAALTAAVLAAATESSTRATLRAAGLGRAAQFTWHRTATRIHRLLMDLAERPADQCAKSAQGLPPSGR
ncbi:MAG TPA: glycosyltransferase family 1 protein [Solirubrobacteraceae bacterium]|nr:glycosyltransferase family 1 protein [Solirubrobacteraceae bacterium]